MVHFSVLLQNLGQHLRDVPNCHTQPSTKCEKCNKTFITVAAFANHMKSHVEHDCKVCGKHFERKGNMGAGTRLWHHMRKHNRAKKEVRARIPVLKHKCKGCDLLFASKKKRSPHQAQCSKIIYQCPRCYEIKCNQRSLTRHINAKCPKFELTNEGQNIQ